MKPSKFTYNEFYLRNYKQSIKKRHLDMKHILLEADNDYLNAYCAILMIIRAFQLLTVMVRYAVSYI